MAEWQEYKLKDAPFEIIDGDRGKNYPSQNEFLHSGHCLFLSTKNVKRTGFDFSDCQFIAEAKDKALRKGKLRRLDIVLTTRGTVGNVAFYGEDIPFDKIRINSGMVIIRPNDAGIYPKYCFYLFRYLQESFETFTSGSAQPQLPIRDLNEMEIYLPDLPEQKSIASILSSLDDKIDLLYRQNKTLEALAETLFRQWFVEEAEEGWEAGKLGDFGKIICGKTPSKKIHSYFGGKIPFIKIPDMHGKTFIFDTEDTLTEDGANSQHNKFLPPKSICVSCIATVGLVAMNALNSQTNQQINSIIPYKEIYRYFLYLKLATMKDELLAMASGGTATDNLNTGDFSNIDIIKPEDNVIELFHNQVQPNFDKIFANQTQIRPLTRLRDTLLPKLMSGEVRVKNAGRLVGKANI